MMDSVILVIDQSTASTKAMLFNTMGALLTKAEKPHQQYYPQLGWVEHDAEEIYRNLLSVVEEVLRQYPVHEIVCLSITNQRETIVVFDKLTGQPLHHAIVWQCRRGETRCREMVRQGYEPMVNELTGLKIDTYFPASKMTWIMETQPQIAASLQRGEALFGTIETYLIYRLTHGQVFASDHTNACRTLLYDIHTMDWNDELCTLFGIPRHSLATVHESMALFGATDCEGILVHPIPICGVMGDSQAALFAQRCYRTGEGKATFGTGSSVLLNVGDAPIRSDSGIVTTIGWVYAGKPTYAFEGITNFTGATLTWLRDQLQLIEHVGETESLANSVADNGGVYLIPSFVGLSAPYWRADVQGAIVGLTPGSTRAHVIRAALESIAYQIRDVFSLMARDANIPLTQIQADGGGVSNAFLMQFVSDMLGLQVRASRLPELSALGAVFSGLLGMGIVDSLLALENLPSAFDDYLPQMDHKLAETYYDNWQRAVQRVL